MKKFKNFLVVAIAVLSLIIIINGLYSSVVLEVILGSAILIFCIIYFLSLIKKREINTNIKSFLMDDNYYDMAGNMQALMGIGEIVDYLESYDHYKNLGISIPKGVVLTGESGTGKTLLIKYINYRTKIPFYYIDFEKYYEVDWIQNVFYEANTNVPAIVCFDGIDCLDDDMVNLLISEMDVMDERVVVIGISNSFEEIDSNLLKYGRFDRIIRTFIPNNEERKSILSLCFSNKKLSEDISIEKLANSLFNFVGSELEFLANESAINAARNNHEFIQKSDIDEALRIIRVGLKDNLELSKNESAVVAYHEAGHALVSTILDEDSFMVSEISVIPRGELYGYTLYFNDIIEGNKKASDILNIIATTLAGREAEIIKFGEPSSGAADDLSRATSLALEMVLSLGLDQDFGPVSIVNIDKEIIGKGFLDDSWKRVREILSEQQIRVNNILKDNIDLLDCLSENIIEKSTLSEDEYKEIIKKHVNKVT